MPRVFVPAVLPPRDVHRLSVGFSRRIMDDAERAADAALQNLAEFEAMIDDDEEAATDYAQEKIRADLREKAEQAEARFVAAVNKHAFDLDMARR